MGDTARRVGFTVLSEGKRRQMATCEECGAVLTPGLGETLLDVLELHAAWHAAMRDTAYEIREQLRAQGFEL